MYSNNFSALPSLQSAQSTPPPTVNAFYTTLLLQHPTYVHNIYMMVKLAVSSIYSLMSYLDDQYLTKNTYFFTFHSYHMFIWAHKEVCTPSRQPLAQLVSLPYPGCRRNFLYKQTPAFTYCRLSAQPFFFCSFSTQLEMQQYIEDLKVTFGSSPEKPLRFFFEVTPS